MNILNEVLNGLSPVYVFIYSCEENDPSNLIDNSPAYSTFL